MAVFRVERTKNYTVMSNYHLKDKRLSLKAKGLLSQMLSLPDDWNYTIAGLCAINRESRDAIRSTIAELENIGYVQRHLTQFRSTEYVIYEQPVSATDGSGAVEPRAEQPSAVLPTAGKQTQSNMKQQNTKQSNTDLPTSLPFFPPEAPQPRRAEKGERGNPEPMQAQVWAANRERIRNQLAYDVLVRDYHMDAQLLDEMVELITEVVSMPRTSVRIAGTDYPYQVVRERFLKLNMDHVQYIADCIRQNASQVRNAKQYLLAVLFNAPATMEAHITAQVNHDRGIV